MRRTVLPMAIALLRSFRLGAGDRFADELLRLILIAPMIDLHPFAGLQILVVGEEVLDLLERYSRQIRVARYPIVAPRQLAARHRQDFLIAPGFVLHDEHAHGPTVD